MNDSFYDDDCDPGYYDLDDFEEFNRNEADDYQDEDCDCSTVDDCTCEGPDEDAAYDDMIVRGPTFCPDCNHGTEGCICDKLDEIAKDWDENPNV